MEFIKLLSTITTGVFILVIVVKISDSMQDASPTYRLLTGVFTLLTLSWIVGLGFKASLGL